MSIRRVTGDYSGTGRRVAIVVGRFNEFITDKLRDGAVDALTRHGTAESDITIIDVPGAFEIPGVARMTADSGRYDAVICLGAVIRGATPHFDFVAGQAAAGLGRLAERASIPVTFGILTTNTIEQAIERAGTKAGNKGAEAAMTALEMMSLYRQLQDAQ